MFVTKSRFSINQCVQKSFGIRSICVTSIDLAKSGVVITGLDIFKNKDPPIVKEISEYPDWIRTLQEPLIPLAKLRKMREEDASEKEMFRYLKLTRRIRIKEANLIAEQK